MDETGTPTEPHWRDLLGPEIGWLTVCGWRPTPDDACRNSAKWHLWLAEGEGYIGACADHVAAARELLKTQDEHEWGCWCNLPGSVWMQTHSWGSDKPIMSWCEQEHGDPLERLDLVAPQPHEQELASCC